jgi:hypothetical protein
VDGPLAGLATRQLASSRLQGESCFFCPGCESKHTARICRDFLGAGDAVGHPVEIEQKLE